jgi:hypothetical protein
MHPVPDIEKRHMLPVSESTITNLVQKVKTTAQTENDRTDELAMLFLAQLSTEGTHNIPCIASLTEQCCNPAASHKRLEPAYV